MKNSTEDSGRPLYLSEHLLELSNLLLVRKKNEPIGDISESLHDVKFHFPQNGDFILAHRMIVACSSPVFEAMLYQSEWPEGVKQPQMLTIDIHETTSYLFLNLLKCIYTDKLLIDYSQLEDIVHLAHAYKVSKVDSFCSQMADADCTIENACELFELAGNSIFQDPLFGLEFICRHMEAVVYTPGFNKLSSHKLAMVLQQNKMDIEELELWEAVYNWARHRSTAVDQKMQTSEIRTALQPLVPFIRFPTLSLKDLLDIVNQDLLDEAHAIVLLQYANASEDDKKFREKLATQMPFKTEPRVQVGGDRICMKLALDLNRRGNGVQVTNNGITLKNHQGSYGTILATSAITPGKVGYFEVKVDASQSEYHTITGLAMESNYNNVLASYIGCNQQSIGWTQQGNLLGRVTGNHASMRYTTGDTIGICVDLKNNRLSFAKNGVVVHYQNLPQTDNTTWVPAFTTLASTTGQLSIVQKCKKPKGLNLKA